MRTVQASEITKNIREMCIEANHFLSDDMKKVFDESVKREESPLGKQILNQLQENLEIAGRDMIPICQDTVWPSFSSKSARKYILKGEI